MVKNMERDVQVLYPKKRTLYFVPWISFEAILFGIMFIVALIGAVLMIINKLFGSTISIILNLYLQYVAAATILIFDSDKLINFLLSPTFDSTKLPSSDQLQALYADLSNTTIGQTELITSLVLAVVSLFFMMWHAYRNGIIKGMGRWIGRSAIILGLVSIPVAHVVSTLFYARSLNVGALAALSNTEMYGKIREYMILTLLILLVVVFITIPVGNGLIFLAGRNKAARDQRKLEKREKRMRRLEKKMRLPKQYY
jgi:hypothetical protein